MKLQRTIAPTAAPIGFSTILRALAGIWSGSTRRGHIAEELRNEYATQAVFLVSSGKAALTIILKALAASSQRRRVVIPAYTCFSVPSAIVRAGLDVVLCDVDATTLDFDYQDLQQRLDEAVLCVLPTHLFGRPANIDRVKALCNGKGIVVVEDAAQAMGAASKGRKIGALGDISFFSLGRGKNLTCGTGGIILVNSARYVGAVRKEYLALPEGSVLDAIKNWMEILGMKLFIHPLLYWLPAELPFLGLGETKFYTTFQMARMDEVRAWFLTGWKDALNKVNRERTQQAERVLEGLKRAGTDAVPITSHDCISLRLPVLVRDRKTKNVVCERSREWGVGISPNYPTTIQAIPELQGRIAARSCPGAETVVDRLVTLPTHMYVTDRDRRKIEAILSVQMKEEEPSYPQAGSLRTGECSHR